MALFVAFAINFILLFYKVSLLLSYHDIFSKRGQTLLLVSALVNTKYLVVFQVTGDYSDDEDPWNGQGRAGEEEEEGALEYFVLQESTGYMAPTLRCLAILHTIISFLCVVGYYYLKVQ